MSTDWAVARDICHTAGSRRLVPQVDVDLGDAAGATLATPVRALADLPGYASSAMDGWVVAGAGPWQLGDPIYTGDPPPADPLLPGRARLICTGAPVPPGPAAVLRMEDGASDGGVLTSLRATPLDGSDIRPQGEEARAGDLLLPAGTRLTPAALALAAASGSDRLTVRTKPKVALVLLGNEVISTGIPPAGKVRDVYAAQLPYLLQAHGTDAPEVVRVGDDRNAVITAFSRVGQQLIISTGGSSHGATDHARAALTAIDAEILIGAVDMRPGHPVVLAVRTDGTLILCLPGSPLAAMTALITLGLLIVDGMLGRPIRADDYVIAGEDLGNSSEAAVRAVAYRTHEGRAVAVPFQGSGMVRGLAAADGLAVVPPGGVITGEAVQCIRLPS